MSSQAGWYPDPGGQPGLYRYWDGNAWSAATTTTPTSAPPNQGLFDTQGASANPAPRSRGAARAAQTPGQLPPRRKSTWGWWVGAGVVLVALIVAVSLFVRGAITSANNPEVPTGQPSSQLCPTTQASAAPDPQSANDGRVHGGALSYPMLPAPWGPPSGDDRVPFGRDVLSQQVTVHGDYRPGQSWVASVLVGELIAGDGFFTPEQGSEIVVKCVTGTFYGDGTEVARDDQVSKATTVDGKEAWLVESHLSFDISGLPTKGELLIVLIVATGDATASLFYASIPDDSPEYVEPARNAMAGLQVEG